MSEIFDVSDMTGMLGYFLETENTSPIQDWKFEINTFMGEIEISNNRRQKFRITIDDLSNE